MKQTDSTEAYRRYHLLVGWLKGVLHQQRALEYITKRKSTGTEIACRALKELEKVQPDPHNGWRVQIRGEANIMRFLERGCSDLGIPSHIEWADHTEQEEALERRTLPSGPLTDLLGRIPG